MDLQFASRSVGFDPISHFAGALEWITADFGRLNPENTLKNNLQNSDEVQQRVVEWIEMSQENCYDHGHENKKA